LNRWHPPALIESAGRSSQSPGGGRQRSQVTRCRLPPAKASGIREALRSASMRANPRRPSRFQRPARRRTLNCSRPIDWNGTTPPHIQIGEQVYHYAGGMPRPQSHRPLHRCRCGPPIDRHYSVSDQECKPRTIDASKRTEIGAQTAGLKKPRPSRRSGQIS
jgi:hypothetical protein